jgi:5-methylcytosine-specific restriction protein A
MPERVERLRGRAGQAQRHRRLQRTNGLCEMCWPSVVRKADVVDHIKPLVLGGSDDDENTRNICFEHHRQVTAEQFGHRLKPRIAEDGWPIL